MWEWIRANFDLHINVGVKRINQRDECNELILFKSQNTVSLVDSRQMDSTLCISHPTLKAAYTDVYCVS